jgi:drug/metabolite transporter (DMT)-like permease
VPTPDSRPVADKGNPDRSPAPQDTSHHNPGLGLALLATGYVIMSITDGVAKLMTAEIAPGEIAWARYVFASLLAIPVVVAISGWRSLLPKRFFANLFRGVMIGSGSAMTFIALQKIPLADAAAIFFIQPFILTILSVIFEGEKVGWRRWSAIAIGFAGALLVIQPSFEEFGFYALLQAMSAACFAGFMLLNRRLRDTAPPLSLQAFSSLAGALVLSLMLVAGSVVEITVFTFTMPTTQQWAILAAFGGAAAVGHSLMVIAFRYATPAVVAPTAYVQILSATIFGYFVFGDFPTLMKWIGIAIIVACGIYVFRRETRVTRGRYGAARIPAAPWWRSGPAASEDRRRSPV